MAVQTFKVNRSSDWAIGASITISYPAGFAAADFDVTGHTMTVDGNLYTASPTLGGTISLPNPTGRVIRASDEVYLTLALATATAEITSTTVAALDDATAAALTDSFPLNQSGTLREATVELIAGLAQAQRALDGFKIPLDKAGNHLPNITIAGATEFTVDDSPAAVNGGSCIVRVIADGTNTPTFTGMTRLGSGNWVNTASTVNVLQVIRIAGTVYYSIAQPA